MGIRLKVPGVGIFLENKEQESSLRKEESKNKTKVNS
jgi:hypothetical protein